MRREVGIAYKAKKKQRLLSQDESGGEWKGEGEDGPPTECNREAKTEPARNKNRVVRREREDYGK